MKFLIIQTAFIGDVVLATPLIEKLHRLYPDSKIDFLLRKGNENLLTDHPLLNKLYIWDKKKHKFSNLFKLIIAFRKQHYDYIINLQRFTSSGLLTILSNSKNSFGFNKNPLSLFFSKSIRHVISKNSNEHEVKRNLKLIESITNNSFEPPRLYPTADDLHSVRKFQEKEYVCMAPASVWFTKQLPKEKWIELCNSLLLKRNVVIFFLGSGTDKNLCDEIIQNVNHQNLVNLSGKLSLLQSAALMQKAQMNYVNDSAPLHIASAMNAPTTVFFCSTVPGFGFGPLSEKSIIVQSKEQLDCRPCGLHGFKSCPEKHFKCAKSISFDMQTLL